MTVKKEMKAHLLKQIWTG